MARPRTPIGTFGEIHVEKTHDCRGRALTRFRDYDGQLRRVQATADTPKAAERRLKEMLAERTEQKVGQGHLTSASSFRHLVDVWLADLDLEDALAPSTRALYERNMRQLVLPAFEHYALREISVRNVDQFIKTRAKTKINSMAKQALTVLSLAFGLAVRQDIVFFVLQKKLSAWGIAVRRRTHPRVPCQTPSHPAATTGPARPEPEAESVTPRED